jgi:hypothetical protein
MFQECAKWIREYGKLPDPWYKLKFKPKEKPVKKKKEPKEKKEKVKKEPKEKVSLYALLRCLQFVRFKIFVDSTGRKEIILPAVSPGVQQTWTNKLPKYILMAEFLQVGMEVLLKYHHVLMTPETPETNSGIN